MNSRLPRSLFCLTAICFGTSLFALTGDVDFADKSTQNDMEALRRWILDKRMVTMREIDGQLSLSGEVRTEFQDINENRNGVQQRGPGGAAGKPAQVWDVEVNLIFDYRTDFTWATIKIEYDNDMGVRSGSLDNLKLEKAYLGGRLVAGDTFTMDSEIGRRQLVAVYDSKLEFGAFFDGIMVRLNKSSSDVGDFYFNPGVFLVDDKTDHYAYVGEVGMLRIANIGLNTKYSVIDWRKHFSNSIKDDRYRFVVQQFMAYYQYAPAWIGKRLLKVYAAGVNNMIAKQLSLYNPDLGKNQDLGLQNWGWYTGVAVGQVKKKGDWAVEGNFQWLQAQAVPDYDCIGIGRGNAGNVGLYTVSIDGSSEKGLTDTKTAVGRGNYYGFELDALYAFTDNLIVEENLKMSWTLDHNIGPNLKYSQFEIEFIYGF